MAKKAEASLIVRIKEIGKEKIKGIGQTLNDVKVKAGVATAAIGAFVGKTVSAFKTQEKAERGLRAAISANGLQVDKTAKKYKEWASAIQEKTTVGDEEILQAAAIAQGMVGNLELTEDLISATIDFAKAQKMDLKAAFSLVGKSVGSSTNALTRYGIEIDSGASKSEKMSQITDVLTNRFDGFAASQAEGLGVLDQFSNSFGDLLEEMGRKFAPAIITVTKLMKDFVEALKQNPLLLKVSAIIIAVTGAVTGLIAVLGTFVALAPAIGGAITIMTGPFGLIVAAIAAVTAAVFGMISAWENDFLGIQGVTFGVFAAIQDLFFSFTRRVGGLFSDLGQIITGAMTLDISKIKSGFQDLTGKLESISDDAVKSFKLAQADRTKKVEEEAKKQTDIEQKAADKRVDINKKSTDDLLEEEEKKTDDHEEEEDKRTDKTKDAAKERAEAAVGIANEAAKSGVQGAAGTVIQAFGDRFIPGLGSLFRQFFDLLSKDSEEFTEEFTQLLNDEFVENILDNIPLMLDIFIEDAINKMAEAPDRISENIPAMVTKLSESLPEAIPAFVEAFIKSIPELIEAIIKALPVIISAWIKLLPNVAAALVKLFSKPSFWKSLAKAFINAFREGFKELGTEAAKAFKKGIKDIGKEIGGGKFTGGGGGGGGGGILGGLTGGLGGGGGGGGGLLSGGGGGGGGGIFHDGGLIGPGGRKIKGYASGGLIDDTLIAAQAGEFVVNKAATSANLGTLQAINNGGSPGGNTVINITVNGGLLGDESSAETFAKAIDNQLLKLRQTNQSVSFDEGTF